MSTYYEKRLATELPKDEDYYHTDRGRLRYNPVLKTWYSEFGGAQITQPKYWLLPLPSPIPSMTPKDALQWLHKNEEFQHTEIDGVDVPTFDSIAEHMDKYAAELVYKHTLSLKQEVEELKESCVKFQDQIFELENNPNFKSDTHKQLDQQVKTLQHSLERVHNYYEPESTITPEDAILAIEDIARMALKETGYDIF